MTLSDKPQRSTFNFQWFEPSSEKVECAARGNVPPRNPGGGFNIRYFRGDVTRE
jgi:hypothetical protein